MKNKLNGRVLLLNSSYEAIATMSIAQAMRKLSKSDCVLQVLEWCEGRTLNTTKGEYPVPSVVRLLYYLDIVKRRNRSGAKRLRIYQRDKYTCQYCNVRIGQYHKLLPVHGMNKHGETVILRHGRKMTISDVSLDHILPSGRGGAHRPDNLVTSCKPCNHRKADRTPDEARMPLLTPQSMLRVHLDKLQLCAYAEYQPVWKKYLGMSEEFQGDERYMSVA